MPEFLYAVERSTKPADQIKGIVCKSLKVSGYTLSESLDSAFSMAEEWCAVPGTYTIIVRRSGSELSTKRKFIKPVP